MLSRHGIAFVVLSAASALAVVSWAADLSPPTEMKGLSQDRQEVVDVSKDYPGFDGRQLRLRRHADRPSITYVVSGEITDHRDGEAPKKVKAGDSFLEPTSLNHWIENEGPDPALLVAVDIFQKP